MASPWFDSSERGKKKPTPVRYLTARYTLALSHYQVRDKEGNYYDVYHREIDGCRIFACECAQYQAQAICPHSLTAAALHSVSGLQAH